MISECVSRSSRRMLFGQAQNADKFEAVLPVSLERCWNLLYSTSSPFITQTMGKFGCSGPYSASALPRRVPQFILSSSSSLQGVTVGDWAPDETEAGVYSRHVSYTKPMQGAMMKVRPSTAPVGFLRDASSSCEAVRIASL